jgi:hypothetical protein
LRRSPHFCIESGGIISHYRPTTSFRWSKVTVRKGSRGVMIGECRGCISWPSSKESWAFWAVAIGRSCTTCAGPDRSGTSGTPGRFPDNICRGPDQGRAPVCRGKCGQIRSSVRAAGAFSGIQAAGVLIPRVDTGLGFTRDRYSMLPKSALPKSATADLGGGGFPQENATAK